MPIRRWPALAAFILISMAACTAIQPTPAAPPLTPTGTPRPTPLIPTETPLPTETPIPSPTLVPSATPTLLATGPLPAPVDLPAIEAASSLLLPPDTPVLGDDLPLVGASVVALGPGYPAQPLVYALSGGTLMRSEDNGATWEFITEGLPENIVEIVVASDGELGAITTEGFAWRGLDEGRLWLAYGLPPGVEQIVFSPNYGADGTVFVVLNNELYRSTQFSGRWEMVFTPLAVCPVRVALARNFVGAGPDVGGDAFLTHCTALAHSTDGGDLWRDVESETPEVWSGGFVAGVAVAPYYPEDPRIVGWGGLGEFALTTDDGLAWADQRAGWSVTPALAFEQVIMSPGFSADSSLLALGRVLPFDPYLTLWRLDGGGAVLTPSAVIPGSACPADVAVAPNGRALVLASCHGLFRSNDAGATWLFLHPGAGVPDPESLAGPARVHGFTEVLVQAVPEGEGESIWRIFLGDGESWVFLDQARSALAPRMLWPSPQFEEDGVIVGLGAEVSGRLHVVSWRPGEARWRDHSDPDALEIPAGDPALLGDYTVFYDINYERTGEISLRYPGTRATFISEDAGLTWARVDPLELGQCDLRPRGPLGGLWEDNAAVRFGLGCPTEPSVDSLEARYQAFERGVFLRISVPVGDEGSFDWRFGLVYGDPEAEEDEPAFKNLWGWLDPPAEVSDLPEPPEDGLLLPDDEFASSWLSRGCCAGYDDWLPLGQWVGWALEPAADFDAVFQPFEGGWLILHREWNQFIVLYQSDPDGATPWETYSNVYEG